MCVYTMQKKNNNKKPSREEIKESNLCISFKIIDVLIKYLSRIWRHKAILFFWFSWEAASVLTVVVLTVQLTSTCKE